MEANIFVFSKMYAFIYQKKKRGLVSWGAMEFFNIGVN